MLKIEQELAKKRQLSKLKHVKEYLNEQKEASLAHACANDLKGKATEIVAKRIGVGTRTVEMYKKAVEIDPSLKEPLLKGEISVKEAYRRAKEKLKRQEKAKRDVKIDQNSSI